MLGARVGLTTISIMQGDITRQDTDGIVNAANEGLLGGGGVDGAIHRAGGESIMRECERIRREQGGCPTGEAVITTAGRLLAKNVIHTVGPIWSDDRADECDRLLAKAYSRSLALAVYHGLRSLSFPSISTGVYGFPIDRAAPLVLTTILDYVDAQTPPLEEIRLVLFSDSDLAVYAREWDVVRDTRLGESR